MVIITFFPCDCLELMHNDFGDVVRKVGLG
jgi:hypothetical protein